MRQGAFPSFGDATPFCFPQVVELVACRRVVRQTGFCGPSWIIMGQYVQKSNVT